MKPHPLASLGLILVLIACGQKPTPYPSTPPDAREWTSFTEGSFSLKLSAGWDKTDSTDEGVIYSVSDGTASIWVKTWPLIPSLVAKGVAEWVSGVQQALLLDESGDPEMVELELALTEDGNTMRLSTILIYCDAKSYEVTGIALDMRFEDYAVIFERVQNSTRCSQPDRIPAVENGALGMVIIPPAVDGDSFSPTAYQRSLALARDSGVQVSHYYFHWGDIETGPGDYDWTIPNYIVEANALEGMQLSIVVSIIHTTVRGRVPADLVGLPFDDPIFSRRLSEFLAAFASRYPGRLHYLAIGNEVNNYFAFHRDQIPAYASAFEAARTAIKEVNPGLPVGIVFAYHDAVTLNTTDIIRELNRGDYIAYTMYLYNQGFHFRRDPTEIGGYIDQMVALAGDKPVAIVVTGWSTAGELDGSEAGQAAYVRQFFAALTDRREKIRFASWFAMHDPRPESCETDALTFFEPGSQPDPVSLQAFVTFICHFGLRESDGTPKLAWNVWSQEAKEYYR